MSLKSKSRRMARELKSKTSLDFISRQKIAKKLVREGLYVFDFEAMGFKVEEVEGGCECCGDRYYKIHGLKSGHAIYNTLYGFDR